MGKRIIQRRRGKGSPTYRANKYAYRLGLSYPSLEGKGNILKLISTSGHSTPIAKIKVGNKVFFNIATNGIEVGQEIDIGSNALVKSGNILPLSSIPIGTSICNIEITPMNGGKMVRTSGISASIVRKSPEGVVVLLPSKKEKVFSYASRATIGVAAGGGRTEKPWVKAGNKFHAMYARNKHWPLTSPIKRNAVNHPWGGGRGKNMGKSGIAPRWAPPGRKVGLLRPRKTGRGGKK